MKSKAKESRIALGRLPTQSLLMPVAAIITSWGCSPNGIGRFEPTNKTHLHSQSWVIAVRVFYPRYIKGKTFYVV
jgi:hypothetical protein